MLASGFLKQKALKALNGKWKAAVGVLLIAGLGGLAVSVVVGILQQPYLQRAQDYYELFFQTENSAYATEYFIQLAKGYAFGLLSVLGTIYTWIFLFPALLFFLETAEGGDGKFKGFTKNFNRIGEGFKTYFLINIRVFLWSLLFIIPGIIKALSYALAPIIKAKNPDRTVSECIQESQRLMNGKKSALFVLYLSFIGWYLLVILAEMGASYIPYVGLYLSSAVSFVATAVLNVYITMCEIMFYKEVVNPTKLVFTMPGTPPPGQKIDVFDENSPFDNHNDDPFA